MKNLFLFLFLSLGINLFAYDFPLKDPYIATVFGSSTLMAKNIQEKIPIKYYTTDFIDTREIPKNLEYQDNYKFTMALQDKKAPLVFILSGTGSSASSLKTEYFQRIFYTAGYHVVGISSIMNTNSLVSLSFEKIPGNLINDGMDLYRALERIKTLIEKKAKVESYNIMGYSLGGTHSAVVSFLDSKEKIFDFKNVFMVNPAVNLFDSATMLDNMFDKSVNYNVDNFFAKVNEILIELSYSKETSINDFAKNPAKILKDLKITENELKMGIGLVFRLNSIDVNFLTDYSNQMKNYSDYKIDKYENMGKYFERVNFASFGDYIEKIALPYYQKNYNKNMTIEDLAKLSDLKIIDDYLKSARNIKVVTNRDEIILNESHFDYLKKTFKDRLHIYPYGGHCGNMFYQENIDYMLKTMKGGR